MDAVRIGQAQAEADGLRDVTPSEIRQIKQRIADWATHHDNFAKGYVMRFAYTERKYNGPIIDRIIKLIEG